MTRNSFNQKHSGAEGPLSNQLLFEEDREEVLCRSHRRLIRVSYQHILIDLKRSKKKKELSRDDLVKRTINSAFACWYLVLFAGLLSYLIAFLKSVLIVGEVDHTLNELQHKSGHHLNVQRLSVLI